jgi:aminoglycoside/choline kinase family phosphotransferase
VLKVSPARRRVSEEAAALARWKTVHVPAVLAVDESLGALLIEALAPGASLAESVAAYPRLESLGALMTALHLDDGPDSSIPPLQSASPISTSPEEKTTSDGRSSPPSFPLSCTSEAAS